MWNPSNPCMHGQRTLNDNDDDDDDDDVTECRPTRWPIQRRPGTDGV